MLPFSLGEKHWAASMLLKMVGDRFYSGFLKFPSSPPGQVGLVKLKKFFEPAN
jgi:hypothetical protein